MKAKEILKELVDELFYYDETSKSCLRHKKSSGNSRTFEGKEAGYSVLSKNKTFTKWVVRIKGSAYSCARIVWVIHNGRIEENLVVDHINGDPRDNRIKNLRLICKSDNGRNQKKPITNTSGTIGVVKKSNGKGNWYWCAIWRNENTKQVSVNFSISKYGEERAYELAVLARKEAIDKLIEKGLNYHENHGRD